MRGSTVLFFYHLELSGPTKLKRVLIFPSRGETYHPLLMSRWARRDAKVDSGSARFLPGAETNTGDEV